MHTRYIMLSPYVATKSQTHNLHMHTRYILPVRTTKGVWVISQPTYAYKIYLWAEYPNKRRKRSQPTHTRYIGRTVIGLEELLHSQPTYAYKIYHCISTAKRERKPLTTHIICIQDISQINTNISCLQGLNL